MTSPTQRAIADLRKDGSLVHIAERWNAYAKIRQDAFGFADLIAVDLDGRVTFIQVTTDANLSARRKKVGSNPVAQRIAVGKTAFVECWGYAKHGEKGKRKLWECQRWVLIHLGENVGWVRGGEVEKT